MVQYYKIVNDRQHRRDGDNIPEMIDIKETIKSNFTSEGLKHYIFDDKGCSATFFDSILQPDSTIKSFGILEDNYTKYGVGLVSRFSVYEDFQNLEVHHHYGERSGKYIGLHSMALVGFRKDKDDKVYYLLQNWWKEKQFVEIDEEYLMRCGGTVSFIVTPQNEIPIEFPKQSGKYFELLAHIDKPDDTARNEL
eukprot:TRINITY_DN5406_c0_g1_i11.p1 TRINITY_DN5406_c0_g1~~TRINITY_DN5406_c0_g1_i11.p1  ORF type:complete len:194 (-),score=38.44 TRINITY_DN5406_c0_g1_i11:138-719(-)